MAASLLALVPLVFASPARRASAQTLIEKIEEPNERLELTAHTSRILTLDHKIPRAQVNNPDLLTLTPLSPNQVQISANKPGVTQVNLWDENGKVYTVDIIIYGDVQELEMALRMQFPHSSVRVFRYSNSLVLTGFVDRPDYVSRIVRLAEDYSPKVINNISVGGVQQVLLHVRVIEVSRTKLRTLGFDFASFSGGGDIISSISGLITGADSAARTVTNAGNTLSFSIVDGNAAFFGFLEALRQNELLKILAEPTLVTVSGRPASFQVGGEFPILVPQSLGTVSVEYKKFGTQVDFVPIVLGNGNIRLEVRPRVSEIDPTRSVTLNGNVIPGLRVREVDTGVEMKAGQTLALAGLIQSRIESQNRGIPWLADLPWVGAGFRRVTEKQNEIELLILVRPEFAGALDPDQVPPGAPGLDTTSPNDGELYFRGYLEVPRCCTDGSCPSCQAGGDAGAGQFEQDGKGIEPIPPADGVAPTEQGSQANSRRRGPLSITASPSLRQPGTDRRSSRHNRPIPPRPAGESAGSSESGTGELVGPIGYDID